MKFVIRSCYLEQPHCYFAAIHGSSPQYNHKQKAHLFQSVNSAEKFAIERLFNSRSAFSIEAFDEDAMQHVETLRLQVFALRESLQNMIDMWNLLTPRVAESFKPKVELTLGNATKTMENTK